jgi:hypothetical protein
MSVSISGGGAGWALQDIALRGRYVTCTAERSGPGTEVTNTVAESRQKNVWS